MKTRQHLSRRVLPVDWIGQDWPVAIRRKPARHSPHQLFLDRGNAWPVAGSSLVSFMNTRHPFRTQRPQAFTLIEMLVVIAIIAILAGILLPVLGTIKLKARIKQAQMEAVQLAAAITAYEKEYNRFPGSKQVEQNGNPDFTFGTTGVTTGRAYESENSLVMYVLLNQMDQAPVPLRDEIKGRNPRNIPLFDDKPAQDGLPGIGTGNKVFRDPWGNPYIITVDLNGDDKCLDPHYKSVGGPGFSGSSPNFEFNGDVMIWSFGPDKKFGAGNDKDNITSWKR